MTTTREIISESIPRKGDFKGGHSPAIGLYVEDAKENVGDQIPYRELRRRKE